MSELAVLQAVRMKGRVSIEDLAATLNEAPDGVAASVAELAADGLLVEGKTLRMSPSGRERLNALLAQERSGMDASAVITAYEEFRGVNAEFKPWSPTGRSRTANRMPTTMRTMTSRCWRASMGYMHERGRYSGAVMPRLWSQWRRPTPA